MRLYDHLPSLARWANAESIFTHITDVVETSQNLQICEVLFDLLDEARIQFVVTLAGDEVGLRDGQVALGEGSLSARPAIDEERGSIRARGRDPASVAGQARVARAGHRGDELAGAERPVPHHVGRGARLSQLPDAALALPQLVRLSSGHGT